MSDQMDTEVEALRAELAAQQAEEEAEARVAEVEQLKLSVLEGKVVAALKKTHGQRGVGFEVWRQHGRLIACHTPKGPQWDAFTASVKADEPLEPHEVRNVVRRSIIEEIPGMEAGVVMAKAEFDKKATEFPGMAVMLASGLHDLAKGGIKARKAKS